MRISFTYRIALVRHKNSAARNKSSRIRKVGMDYSGIVARKAMIHPTA